MSPQIKVQKDHAEGATEQNMGKWELIKESKKKNKKDTKKTINFSFNQL